MSTCLELLKEIEKAIKTGSKELILITSSNKKSLENHFNRNFELEYSLDKNRKYELLKNDEKYNSRKYKLSGAHRGFEKSERCFIIKNNLSCFLILCIFNKS